MSTVNNYAGENWMITPTALALNESKPQNAIDQNFLLVLSGVVVVDFEGTLSNDWNRETITISPDVFSPLEWAITRWGIPPPPPQPENLYRLGMSLTAWAPFAALSSVFSNGASSAGYAVDQWRPTPFPTNAQDVFKKPVSNLFSGIDVDLAVRNSNAALARVSYQITLEGKLVYLPY